MEVGELTDKELSKLEAEFKRFGSEARAKLEDRAEGGAQSK